MSYSINDLLQSYVSQRFNNSAIFNSAFFPGKYFKTNQAEVKRSWLERELPKSTAVNINISIPAMNSSSKVIRELQSYFESIDTSYIDCILIHGSYADHTNNSFSDIDGLVILKSSIFENGLALTAYNLFRAQRIINKTDPLQHHSWFIMTEEDYKCWPEHYLPIEVLKRSRSLLSEKEIMISGITNNYNIVKNNFNSISGLLINSIKRYNLPSNAFTLKSFLSRFMLLPSLFIHLTSKQGIYKGESFNAAQKYFTEQEWKIMNDVSDIRTNWKYHQNFSSYIWGAKASLLSRKMLKKYGPEIPADIKKHLTHHFYERIIILVDRMIEIIEKEESNDRKDQAIS